MAETLIHRVNDAADAITNAVAFINAINFVAAGVRDRDLSNALMACSRSALDRLGEGYGLLDAIAEEHRRQGAPK